MTLTDQQARRRQASIGVGIGIGCWALLALLHVAGAFDTFDLRLLDLRFRLRGERPASASIALVVVDDATIRSYGSWPIPRDQYALLLQALEDAGARAIGMDVMFPDDAAKDTLHDQLLAYLSARHPEIVHAISFQSETPAGAPVPVVLPASLVALRDQGRADSTSPVTSAASVLVPCSELMRAGVTLGHITVATDRDGAIRRQPLAVRYQDRVYASLGLRMVGAGLGHSEPPQTSPAAGGIRLGWPRGPGWRLPLDREGAVALDFAGDRRAFPNVSSMVEVLRDYRENGGRTMRPRFHGRYVLVGLDSRTEVAEDVGTTPFSTTTPLVFVHANVIDDLLRSRFLHRPSPAPYLAGLAIPAGAMGGLFALLPMPAALAAVVVALGAIGIADLVLLARWSIDAPPMVALLLTPAIYGSVSTARYLFLASLHQRRETEIREGRSIEQQFLPEALIGRDLSRYRVLDKLGSGGMGIVYRAHDPRLNRDVAIKVLPARALADERTRRRFRREALSLSRVNHPHIAGVFDFDSQDGTDFLVMELVAGEVLTMRLKRGSLHETEIVRITSQILEGLAEAHRIGMVHRDLKPDNVMLTARGEVKLLDFGLATMIPIASMGTSLAATLTEVGHMVGTVPYMAPEVLRGEPADPRSDLYSLGVMLFEMSTGRRPFPNDELHELVYTVLHQSPPAPRILNGRISEPLEAIILKLLAKEPDDRFASAPALLAALHGGRESDAEAAEVRSGPEGMTGV